MKIEVIIEEQPKDFIRRQPPEARKQLRAALHDIENKKNFPEPLEDELDGFYKVKVQDYRLILKSESGNLFKVVFAERRKMVYEIFRQVIGFN